jgi:hypothetical protein
MKLSLLLGACLLLAGTAHAQGHSMSNAPSTGQGLSYSSWGSGPAFSGLNHQIGRHVDYQPPTQWELVYAKNDGSFVPSTFMSYEEALALGKQLLAEQEQEAQNGPVFSLAEAARVNRATKLPTFELRSRVVQDDHGKLTICNLSGNDCHRI